MHTGTWLNKKPGCGERRAAPCFSMLPLPIQRLCSQLFVEEGWLPYHQLTLLDATVVHYRPGEGVEAHVDAQDVTILIYLSGKEEGDIALSEYPLPGSTHFTHLNCSFAPTMGHVLLYHSTDLKMLHSSVPLGPSDDDKFICQLLLKRWKAAGKCEQLTQQILSGNAWNVVAGGPPPPHLKVSTREVVKVASARLRSYGVRNDSDEAIEVRAAMQRGLLAVLNETHCTKDCFEAIVRDYDPDGYYGIRSVLVCGDLGLQSTMM